MPDIYQKLTSNSISSITFILIYTALSKDTLLKSVKMVYYFLQGFYSREMNIIENPKTPKNAIFCHENIGYNN